MLCDNIHSRFGRFRGNNIINRAITIMNRPVRIRMQGGVGFLLPTNMTIQLCANHHVRQFL